MSPQPHTEILDGIAQLVAFKTTAGNMQEQNACLKALASMFAGDLQTTEYMLHGRPALVLSTHGGKENDVVLSGHIDVVSGDDALYVMRNDGDHLYGRGVYDMKGPLLAALFGMRDAIRSGVSGRFSALITADEELDGKGTEALLAEEGYRSNVALIPDGGDETRIIVAQKGFMQVAVTFRGKSAHASYPWEGVNPIDMFAGFVRALAERYPTPQSMDEWKTTAVVTKVEGGSAYNQIPNTVTAYLDVRYISPEEPDVFMAWIDDTFGDTVHAEIIRGNGMFNSDAHNPHLVRLQRTIEKHTGTTPVFSRECGTSDGIFFTDHGIPAALFRPQGGGAHADDEWVHIDSLHMVYNVIYDYIRAAEVSR